MNREQTIGWRDGLPKVSYYIGRQELAVRIIGGLLFMAVLGPVVSRMPVAELNRPFIDYISLLVLLIWLIYKVVATYQLRMNSFWHELALWMLPLSYLISDIGFILLGHKLSFKHYQALLFAVRPVPIVEFVIFLCTVGKIRGEWSRELAFHLLKILAIVTIFVGLVATTQYIQVPVFAPIQNSLYKYENALLDMSSEAAAVYGRVSSIFRWFNTLGQFAFTVSILLLPHVFCGRGTLLNVSALGMGVAALVFSGSRTGLIGFALGAVIILLYLRQIKPLLYSGMAILATAVIVMSMGLANPESSRLFELVAFLNEDEGPETFEGRQGRWDEFLVHYHRDYAAYVPTGITPTTNVDELLTHNGRVGSFDSEYLRTYVWNGAIGLGLLISFQIIMALRTWTMVFTCKARGINNCFGISLATLFTVMPILAISQQVWTNIILMHLFYIFLGAYLHLYKLGEDYE